MNTRTFLLASMAALGFSGAPVQLLANNDADHGRSAAPSRLIGAWRVTITPYNCSTGQSLPANAFDVFFTFGAFGTVAEVSSNTTLQPGQRSPGHGYWKRTGARSYHVVSEAFILFTSVVTPPATPRYVRGWQRLEQEIEFVDRDHWTSIGTATFFDIGGTVVPPSGCLTTTAVRID